MNYSKLIEESLDRQRREFERTHDPLIALAAFRTSRGHRKFDVSPIPVPQWILRFLDAFTERLEQVGDDGQAPDFDWQSAIVQSLGFRPSTRGGPSNPFRTEARNEDRYTFAVRMRVLIDGDGQQETYAAEEVARYWGVSASTVRRAWKVYGPVVRTEDLEEQTWDVRLADGVLIPFYASPSRLAHYGKNQMGRDAEDQLTAEELLYESPWNLFDEWLTS